MTKKLKRVRERKMMLELKIKNLMRGKFKTINSKNKTGLN